MTVTTTQQSKPNVCNVPNRTIFEGDNLEVMRGINDACIDLIYLDPPFNSNRDYAAPIGSKAAGAAFKDTWDLTDIDEAWHNQIADTDLPLYKVIEASQYSHGNGMKSYLIMMAVRLLEMKRILKPTGSIYLHCDDTASHYLKVLMDSVFGQDLYRNDIAWNRSGGKSDSKRWGRVSDNLLFYSAGSEFTWHQQFQPHDPGYVEKTYRHDDGDGRGSYTTMPLHAAGIRSGESGTPWGGYDPNKHGRHWATPTQGIMHDYIVDRGLIPDWPTGYPGVHLRLEALDEAGLIAWSRNGVPRIKTYLQATNGVAATDIIADIPMASGNEKTGYPTQKPLALLERIIKASSNSGDVVMDPFCGCATTCIAAERLDRQWIGIDLSSLAVKLVEQRAHNELGLMGGIQCIARTDIPLRTDREPPPPFSESKITLYGTQGGSCNGCGTHFLPQHLTVDHIIARSKGGTGHLDNLQLLCGHCNSLKGNHPMEYLKAKLARDYQ